MEIATSRRLSTSFNVENQSFLRERKANCILLNMNKNNNHRRATFSMSSGKILHEFMAYSVNKILNDQ